jgi:hypothetical protein
MQSDTLLTALSQSGFENLTFNTPWSACLVGMTPTASNKQLFTLQQFQAALIERVGEAAQHRQDHQRSGHRVVRPEAVK